MTTEPIKPASPLPWKLEEGSVWHADGSFVVDSDHISYGDMPYIVHACNNYPALVEALQNLMLAADDMAYHRNPSRAGWDDLSTFVESARAALAAAQKGLDR